MAGLSSYAANDAGIADRIIYPLSLGDNTGSIDPGDGISFTYGVAGIGFLSAASDSVPYQRALSNVLKNQVNNSEQPGDQSFTNWWLRSQTDWSAGAGTISMEPISVDKIARSYYESYGIDVWTAGQISLLKSTSLEATISATVTGNTPVLYANGYVYVGANLTLNKYDTSTWASTAITGFTAGETITSLAQGNGYIYICTNAAVYMVTVAGTSVTKIYTFPTADTNARVFFAKDRLILCSKGAIWDQAPPAASATNTTLSNSTALYKRDDTHRWVSVAVAPQSILIGGVSDSQSAIYSMGLVTTGALPVLGAPTVVAEFPANEQLKFVGSYLGAYLAVATSLGVRIGTINGASISYGPLLTAPIATGDFAAYDRFLVYPTTDAGDSRSGVVRIDLSDIDTTSRAAWANDLRIPTGSAGVASSVVVLPSGASVIVAKESAAVKIYGTDATYEPVGFLSSSEIRLGTTEKKYHDNVNIQLDPDWYGTLAVSSMGDDGVTSLVGSVTSLSGYDIDMSIDNNSSSSKISLGFTMQPSEDGLNTPVLKSWQLRALPAVQRARLIKIPLSCWDRERDHRGVPFGYEGYAVARWKSLEEQIRTGMPFTLQDLYTNETFRVILDSVSFNQSSPPAYASGFGGVIDLTVRVIG
jgi:hypothetical protein